METKGGSRSIEKKISRRSVEKKGECWPTEHSIVGHEVVATFTVIFKV
jgi:membrane-associated PAP2 superfamily phosphatase